MTPALLKANIRCFTARRKEASSLKTRLKKVNGDIDKITTRVSAHMALFAVSNLEAPDGGKVGTTTNYYPVIEDLDAFTYWAGKEGQEFVNENFANWKEKYHIGDTIKPTVMNIVANRSVALAMLKHFRDVAEKEGLELASLLPPGLLYTAKTSLTYRRPTTKQVEKKKTGVEIKSALETIREMMQHKSP